MRSKLHIVNLNNFVKPDPQSFLTQSTKWITNGVDNDYFYTVEKAYYGSPTNASIIDNYANYILGEGIYDEAGLIKVEDYLSEEDQRLLVTDFKTQGACALQVIYNLGGEISKLYFNPVKTLAINREPDITDDVTGYWYSYDWRLRTRFKPIKYPTFGFGEKDETEILYIKRQTNSVYSVPDWQSGIQYCQTEEELSNYYINHIRNNFSAGKIVNVNQGIPGSEEAQLEAELAIKSQLTGSSNAGSVIISFNDNKENATTVENIEITDAYSQFEFISKECVDKIMLAHKVNDKSLFGIPMASGFSSVAEQMLQSLKILYRSQINPARRLILKQLEVVFKEINPNVRLKFKDFEELSIAETPTPTQNNLKVNPKLVSFDFDDTLTTKKGIKELEIMKEMGKEIYIISARSDRKGLDDFAKSNGIPLSHVFATGSNESKILKIKELGISKHFENNKDVISQLGGIGIDINSI